jgi:hypothetical protein
MPKLKAIHLCIKGKCFPFLNYGVDCSIWAVVSCTNEQDSLIRVLVLCGKISHKEIVYMKGGVLD